VTVADAIHVLQPAQDSQVGSA